MKTMTLDCRGMACPLPVLKMTTTVMAKEVVPGDTLEVLGDCPTFEGDVKKWCETMKKVLLYMKEDPGHIKHCAVRI